MNRLMRLPALDGLAGLQERVNRLFGDFMTDELPTVDARSWIPALDLTETEDAVEVKLEVPGVDPSRLEIAVVGDVLEVTGEKPVEEQRSTANGWARYERRTGSFRRRVALPVPVNADKIEARAKHGLVTIHLPKRAEVLPKRIAVKSA